MSAAEMSYDVRYFLAFINPSYGVNANRMKKFAFRVDEKLYDFDELTVASAIFFSFSYFAFKSDIFKLFLNAISVLTYLLTTYITEMASFDHTYIIMHDCIRPISAILAISKLTCAKMKSTSQFLKKFYMFPTSKSK